MSPAIKVLERLLLPYCVESLPSATSQHGYKAGHSCTTALLPVVTSIVAGFNEANPASRTVMVSLIISKAFDAINHVLIEKISNTDLPMSCAG